MHSESPYDLLARSVTHHLRQDLSLIVGYAELLTLPRILSLERVGMVAEIREAAGRMAGALARLDSPEPLGRVRLGPEELLDLRSPGAPTALASLVGRADGRLTLTDREFAIVRPAERSAG